MHSRVWKFTLPVEDTFKLAMPVGATVLTVGTQPGDGEDVPVMWATVDPGATTETRTFHTRGTGHLFTGTEGAYVGTYLLDEGKFVGHVFEAVR